MPSFVVYKKSGSALFFSVIAFIRHAAVNPKEDALSSLSKVITISQPAIRKTSHHPLVSKILE